MRRGTALIIAAAAACGLAGAAGSTSGDVWKKLHRPLHIPRIEPGSPCPVSQPDTRVNFRAFGVGQGFGPGPAYPILGGRRAGFEFEYPPSSVSIFHGSTWGGQKVLWFLLPGNGGRVLVRGRQLDGRDAVRFGQALRPSAELRLIGPRDHPSTTRLRAGGCYGYQIDGPAYSRVVIFRAVAVPPDGQREQLVAALRAAGLALGREVSQDAEFVDFLEGFGHGYENGSGPLVIFELPSEPVANAVSGRISPDGQSLTSKLGYGVLIDFVGSPHWFRSRRLLILYVGDDAQALAILQRVLGAQFAGHG